MFKYVSLALVAITAIIVLINLIKGLIRGFKKTIGSLAAIVLSAVIALIITAIICNPGSSLMTWVIDLVKGLIGGAELEDIFAISELGESIAYYIAMVAAPFVFLVLYIVLSMIISIVVGIVIKFIPPIIKKKGLLHRLGGLGVGIVCGLLVSILVLMPVVGVLNIVISVGESGILESEDGSDNELVQIIDEASEDKLYAVYSILCGWMFDALASADYDGEKVYLKEDIEVILIVVNNIDAISGDVSEFGDDQVNALNTVVDNLDRSALLKNTLSGVLSSMASKWIAGESFLGVEAIDAGELLNPLIHSVLEVMSTSTKDTITDDMRTLVNMIDVMSEYKLLENVDDFEKILEVLSAEPEAEDGESAIEALINVANANPRMTKLSDEITMLSIRALASTLGIPENDDELYSDLMNEIALVLNDSRNHSDRDAYVEEKVADALDTYGVNISGNAAEHIADSLLKDFANKSNVDGKAVKEFFMLYAVASGSANEGSGLYLGYDRLSQSGTGISTDPATGKVMIGDYVFEYYDAFSYDQSAAFIAGNSGVDFGDAESLYSSGSMRSNIITLSDIFSAEGVKKFSELNNEEAKAESKKIAEMLALAGDMFNGNFSNPDYRALIKDMGSVLDKMSEMRIFGVEATAKLLEAVFQSEDVKGSLGLPVDQLDKCVHDIVESAKKEGNNYESITKSVASMLNMMDRVNDKNSTAEEKIATTRELMQNLTPDNAELLSSMATPEMMKEYVKNEEKAESVSNSVSSLFNNMAALNTEDEEVYNKEAEAVNTMLNLAMEGSSSDEKAMFTEFDQNGNVIREGKMDTDAAGFVELIATSSVVSKTVNETVDEGEENPYGLNPSDEDEAILSSALTKHYDEAKGDLNAEEREELKKTLSNIATLSNITVPVFD